MVLPPNGADTAVTITSLHSAAPPVAPSSSWGGATDFRRSLLREAIRSFSFFSRLFSSKTWDERSTCAASSSEASAELAEGELALTA